MNNNILSKILFGGLLAVSASGFAAMDTDERLEMLEKQMEEVRTETSMGTYGAKTASARAEVNGKGWNIDLDVFYWKGKVGGTEYAYSDNDPVTSLPIRGRTKNMDFSWDWGVRLGLGYNFLHDGWDALLSYTWFDNSGSDSRTGGVNDVVVPLRGSSEITENQGAQFNFAKSANSQFDLDVNLLDLGLGRSFFVSSSLSMRPHIGLRSAWIDLEQDTKYSGGTPDGSTNWGLGVNNVSVDDKCNFWGLGPRAGFDTKWHLGNGFSIFGNVAGSLLYGNFDVDHKEKYSADENARISLDANVHGFSPNVQFALGLGYDTYINNDKQHIGLGIGYENQYFWRQNQMLKIDDASPLKYERYSEDVAMQGITFNFKFDF